MKRTVTTDGANITIDINNSFSQMDKMCLAARMPDELVKAAEAADSEEEFDFDLTVDVIDYFENVLKETTQLDDDTLDSMSCQDIGELASAVVAGMPDDASMEDFHYDPSRDELQFIFSSNEWSKISESAEIPLVQAHVIQMSGDV